MTYPFESITNLTHDGFTVSDNTGAIRVIFRDCNKFYVAETNAANSRCVGTRDVSRLVFTFCGDPEVSITCKKPGVWKRLFSRENGAAQFHDFQKKIEGFGYTTMDLT
jgi:hypothetical protein